MEKAVSRDTKEFNSGESTIADSISSAHHCSTQLLLEQENQNDTYCRTFWNHIGIEKEPPGILLKWAAQLELESNSLHENMAHLTKLIKLYEEDLNKHNLSIRKLTLMVENGFLQVQGLADECRQMMDMNVSPTPYVDALSMAEKITHNLMVERVFGNDDLPVKLERLERGILHQNRIINDIKHQMDSISSSLHTCENELSPVEDQMDIESQKDRRRTIAITGPVDYFEKPKNKRKMSLY